MASGTKLVVYAALVGNIGVALAKYVVAFLSGSSAMLAEAFHSTVDISNEVLMLVGMRRSQRPPTPQHPFGFGREVYFWSFLVAILFFALGGGLSIWEGIGKIRAPGELDSPMWSYVVLGIAALFDGSSWVVGMREVLKHRRPGHSLWQTLHLSKDPNLVGVFLEDSADIIGLALAAIGVWASHHWHMSRLDGIASLLIGLLLASVALLFGREVMGLLIGEAADPEVLHEIKQAALSDPDVELVGEPLTSQLAPDQIILNMDMRFRSGLDRDGIETAIDRVEAAIKKSVPEITRIFLEAESLKSHDGSRHAT
jgi:cation diffusion facilitator family transporter